MSSPYFSANFREVIGHVGAEMCPMRGESRVTKKIRA